MDTVVIDEDGLEKEDNVNTEEIGIVLKAAINNMANIFYRMQGYNQPAGFDFSSSPHPTEKGMFELAKASHTFWMTK